jgi:hypothetical protein
MRQVFFFMYPIKNKEELTSLYWLCISFALWQAAKSLSLPYRPLWQRVS